MASCPSGHESATSDYCDECGAPMGGAPAGGDPAATAALGAVAPAGKRCPVCGDPLDGRFCERCGHDAEAPAPAAPTPAAPDPAAGGPTPGGTATAAQWTAVVRADRGWFDQVRARGGADVAALEFPRYCPERRFLLSGSQMAIGRRSRSRGVEPEIDLSGPPLDPGVSALHALLLSRSDGGWELVDLESTNGTVVDGSTEPIAPNQPVPLPDGATIKLGAWTTITVSAAPAAEDERLLRGSDQSR